MTRGRTVPPQPQLLDTARIRAIAEEVRADIVRAHGSLQELCHYAAVTLARRLDDAGFSALVNVGAVLVKDSPTSHSKLFHALPHEVIGRDAPFHAWVIAGPRGRATQRNCVLIDVAADTLAAWYAQAADGEGTWPTTELPPVLVTEPGGDTSAYAMLYQADPRLMVQAARKHQLGERWRIRHATGNIDYIA